MCTCFGFAEFLFSTTPLPVYINYKKKRHQINNTLDDIQFLEVDGLRHSWEAVMLSCPKVHSGD